MTMMTVHLAAGDALFLPEGWWHSVTSSPGTLAVNYWYDGAQESGPVVDRRRSIARLTDALRHLAHTPGRVTQPVVADRLSPSGRRLQLERGLTRTERTAREAMIQRGARVRQRRAEGDDHREGGGVDKAHHHDDEEVQLLDQAREVGKIVADLGPISTVRVLVSLGPYLHDEGSGPCGVTMDDVLGGLGCVDVVCLTTALEEAPEEDTREALEKRLWPYVEDAGAVMRRWVDARTRVLRALAVRGGERGSPTPDGPDQS